MAENLSRDRPVTGAVVSRDFSLVQGNNDAIPPFRWDHAHGPNFDEKFMEIPQYQILKNYQMHVMDWYEILEKPQCLKPPKILQYTKTVKYECNESSKPLQNMQGIYGL